ncbi:MAG TPA: cytochrome P450 [Candidatus Binataceae bacterium]|nr:cytochrome P450 [Candidatus Binataceae bacterium]
MNLDYDPFSPEFRADPYPVYEELRRSAPVYWAERSKTWVVSRYDDVAGILKDTQRFSSDAMASVLTGSTRHRSDATPPRGSPRPSLVTSDPPVHTGLRNILNRGFTPRQISAWKPAVERAVSEAIDSIHATRRFDVIAQLAIPVPVIVIAEVLGVEPGRYPDFKRWATVITVGMNGSKRHLGFVGSGAAAASAEMSEYLRRVIARRTAEGEHDLISVLVRASEGEVLTPDEAIIFANLLLFAGTETTANLIGNAAHALLTHPGVLARVQAAPDLIPAAIEETLRWDPPVHYLFRRATAPVEIAGVAIPKDAIVTILLASANRDETAFGSDATVFNIDRKNEVPHIAFGFGIHFCLGAALARMEATTSLQQLVPVLSGARRVTEQLEFIDSFQFRGLASLEMEWTR